MRIVLDETGLVSGSDAMFSCGTSISCFDDSGFDSSGGGGGILSGGVSMTGVASSEALVASS